MTSTHPLTKIPILARVARFACRTTTSVFTFATINSASAETIVDFQMAQILFENLLAPMAPLRKDTESDVSAAAASAEEFRTLARTTRNWIVLSALIFGTARQAGSRPPPVPLNPTISAAAERATSSANKKLAGGLAASVHTGEGIAPWRTHLQRALLQCAMPHVAVMFVDQTLLPVDEIKKIFPEVDRSWYESARPPQNSDDDCVFEFTHGPGSPLNSFGGPPHDSDACLVMAKNTVTGNLAELYFEYTPRSENLEQLGWKPALLPLSLRILELKVNKMTVDFKQWHLPQLAVLVLHGGGHSGELSCEMLAHSFPRLEHAFLGKNEFTSKDDRGLDFGALPKGMETLYLFECTMLKGFCDFSNCPLHLQIFKCNGTQLWTKASEASEFISQMEFCDIRQLS